MTKVDEALAKSLEPDWRDCPSRYLQRAVGRVRAMDAANRALQPKEKTHE